MYFPTVYPLLIRGIRVLYFTLVLDTPIDKSWLIYLALYIWEGKKKEKDKNRNGMLLLDKLMTQIEKNEIHFTPFENLAYFSWDFAISHWTIDWVIKKWTGPVTNPEIALP